MVAGIIFILAGILLLVYPPLLSIVVASIMIFSGVFLLYLGHSFKKTARRFDDPFIDFFFRI